MQEPGGKIRRRCQSCCLDRGEASPVIFDDDALETSRKLAEELKANAPPPQSALRPPEDPPLFTDHDGNAAKLRPDLDRLVERVFHVPDVDATYDRLEKGLTIGEKHGDRGTVTKALDEATECFMDAHRLFCAVSIERTRYELDAAVVEAGMRATAIDVLEQEKANGERKKQITEADVIARCRPRFLDKQGALALKRFPCKLTADHSRSSPPRGRCAPCCLPTRELLRLQAR